MEDLGLAEMQAMQRRLREKYEDRWGKLAPEKGREQLLWMIGEAGEVADVIKKRGDGAIQHEPEIRTHFIEEMCDVLMYFNEVLLCYGVSQEEFRQIYVQKHERNMSRW